MTTASLAIGVIYFVLVLLASIGLRGASGLRLFVISVALVAAGLALQSLSQPGQPPSSTTKPTQLEPLHPTAPRRGMNA